MMTNNMELLNDKNILMLSNIDNVFLDCDGVIWSGIGILNKANLAVNKLKSLGKNIFLVTNSSVRTQSAFIQRCEEYDIKIDKEHAVCVPAIMAQYLKKIKFDKKIYIIGTQGFAEELKTWGFHCIGPVEENLDSSTLYETIGNGELGLDPDVGAVAVGYDGGFNYGKLVKASCYLRDPDCLFLGCNIDEKYPVVNTKYYLPAGGVLVRAVESASGRKATIIGKPSTLMFDVLASKFDLNPEKSLMIGDTLETDMVFGNKCGMKTLLVLTGVASKKDVEDLCDNKDNVNKNLIPNYYIASLGDLLYLI